MKSTVESITMEQARRLGPAGLKAFFRLASLWDLTIPQQMTLLGHPKRSTYFEWKKNPDRDFQPDTVERLSYLIGIYKALQILLPDAALADTWIKRLAHAPPFGGKTPLSYMLRGDMLALYEVRNYLDAQRGAW